MKNSLQLLRDFISSFQDKNKIDSELNIFIPLDQFNL